MEEVRVAVVEEVRFAVAVGWFGLERAVSVIRVVNSVEEVSAGGYGSLPRVTVVARGYECRVGPVTATIPYRDMVLGDVRCGSSS